MDPAKLLLIAMLLKAMTIALNILESLTELQEEEDTENEIVIGKQQITDYDESEEFPDSLASILFLSMLTDEFRLPRGTLTGIRYGRWYIRPRSVHWWFHYEGWVMQVDPGRFKELFRVSQDTFHYICSLVAPALETNTPPTFSGIPNRVLSVEKQVAIALKRLASGDSFLSISELFGIGSSTAARVTIKFVHALLQSAQHYLEWPTGDAMAAVKRGFQSIHGFPNCCGEIDATHILMELPAYESEVDWFDRKGNYSMLVQAIVDSRTKFLDVVAGYPGSVNDARQLRISNFAQLVERQERLNGSAIQINNHSVREYIIGDAGYPLLPWLIVPFPGTQLPPITDRFNYMHSSTRMAVERAFGLLKWSWQLLHRKIYKPNKEALSRTILACCMLHNIMIDRGERYSQAVIESIVGFDPSFPYLNEPVGREANSTGFELRQVIRDYLWTRR